MRRHTNHLQVLSYNTFRVRTHENVQIQDSSNSHPGESRGRLQCHLWKDITASKQQQILSYAGKDVSKPISTNCIAVEKENSMCQAIFFLDYVEWMRAIKIGISLWNKSVNIYNMRPHNQLKGRK